LSAYILTIPARASLGRDDNPLDQRRSNTEAIQRDNGFLSAGRPAPADFPFEDL
jgi:hypothetical protein